MILQGHMLPQLELKNPGVSLYYSAHNLKYNMQRITVCSSSLQRVSEPVVTSKVETVIFNLSNSEQ